MPVMLKTMFDDYTFREGSSSSQLNHIKKSNNQKIIDEHHPLIGKRNTWVEYYLTGLFGIHNHMSSNAGTLEPATNEKFLRNNSMDTR